MSFRMLITRKPGKLMHSLVHLCIVILALLPELAFIIAQHSLRYNGLLSAEPDRYYYAVTIVFKHLLPCQIFLHRVI